jgi:hypothetical protein
LPVFATEAFIWSAVPERIQQLGLMNEKGELPLAVQLARWLSPAEAAVACKRPAAIAA